MKKKEKLPLRGMRPLDGCGVYLLSQVSLIMVQALASIILLIINDTTGMDYSESRPFFYIMSVITQVAFIVTPIIYCRYTGVSFLRELDFKRGIGVGQGFTLVAIALASIVAFLPLANIFVLCMQKLGYSYEMTVPSFVENAGLYVATIFLIGILTPFGEEIMYRGFLAKGLRRFGMIATILLGGFIFAIAHGNLLQLVHQFLLGMVLVTVYMVTRSIYASIIVHSINNIFAVTFNFILYQTTGKETIEQVLNWKFVGIALAVSLLGIVILCLFMWLFLYITKRRQLRYIGDREVDIESSKVYGNHNKKANNFVTKYFAHLRWLAYSFEDEELEKDYKIQEELNFMNASTDEQKKYTKELLESRIDKDKRWDRNLLFMAIAYSMFLLILNIVKGFTA